MGMAREPPPQSLPAVDERSAILMSSSSERFISALTENNDGSVQVESASGMNPVILNGSVKEEEYSQINPVRMFKFPVLDTMPQAGLSVENLDGEFLCGWGAAFINISVTFPINKAIFRQQLQGIHGYKAFRQLRNEGLRNLYRGLLPPLLLKTTTMSIMFGFYNKFQLALDSSFPSMPRSLNHAVAAMMAGTLEATLTPFERIQTLLQDRTYHQRFNNTVHAAKELRAFGFREYYRGSSVILLRNGPSNVIFFWGREFVSEILPDFESSSSRIVKDFLCGACLGAMISTGFFPFNVVKTRMQSRLGGPFYGVWHSFQEVWVERNRSIPNLFRGFHLNYTRSFISWGIINASYEYLLAAFQQFKLGRNS